ncbi:MAG: hypothetical protein AAFO63_01815 [Pseudomonadota bacterium]
MSLTVLLVATLPLSQSAIALNARDEQARLNTCIEKVETVPEEAYEDSLAWLSNGNRPKARYCNAISLIALERTEEGAARLEALANAPDPISLENRALYMTQAGNAWLSSNYPEAAVTAFSAALNIQPNNADIYIDRGAARLALEDWMLGIDDLSQAISLAPTKTEAFYLRSSAFLETEDYAAAQADLDVLLAREPENLDYLVLRGDIREAIRLRENGVD